MADENDTPSGGAGLPLAQSLDETPNKPGVSHDPNVESAKYDPAKDREKKRGQIAMLLVWLLVGIVVGTFLLTLGKAACVDTDEGEICSRLNVVDVRILIEMLLTPVVALVGAVTGFYFGESKG